MGDKRRRRRRRRKNTKFITWFKKLSTKKKVLLCSGVALGCLMVVGVLFVASKFSKINIEKIPEKNLIVNEEAEEQAKGYTNFVLFGGDSRTGNLGKGVRTDSIIVVNLNNETKEIKMVSVYRDTLLDLSKGKLNKANAAYSAGGAEQAINMLNMNLDLNIQKFVTVDFSSVSEVIDLLGGIEVEVSDQEAKEVNKFIDETAKVAGKKANHLKKGGLQTLDGVQATTYARIRKRVGDDYQRTVRQRLVIQKALEKAMKADIATINKIIDKVFPTVYTNLTMSEILSYAKHLTKYKITESQGFPTVKTTATLPGKGSCVIPITLKKNVQELHKFLYGTEDYKPSSKVESISSKIQGEVGNKKPDADVPYTGNETNTEQPDTPTTDPNTSTTKPDTPTNDCTHELGTEWQSDKDGHWHKCDCGEKTSEIEKHTLENVEGEAVQICKVCGYESEVSSGESTCKHEGAEAKYDSQYHWFYCPSCKQEIEKDAHELGEEGTDGSKSCAKCDYKTQPTTPPVTQDQ